MISETQFRRDLNLQFSHTSLLSDLSEFLFEAIHLYKDQNKMNRKQIINSLTEIANKPIIETQFTELLDWFEEYCIKIQKQNKLIKGRNLFTNSIQAIKKDKSRNQLKENEKNNQGQDKEMITKKIKPTKNNNQENDNQSMSEEKEESHSQENQNDKLMLFLLLTVANQQNKIQTKQPQVKQQPTHNVRCRYFPNCTNKSCQYIHPTYQCKYFPNCNRGKQCIYLHKQCKHGIHCKNEKCVYDHPYIKQ